MSKMGEINACNKCGKCCKNFGPVGLMILPWELKNFQEKADAINKSLKLGSMALSEEVHKKNLVVSYYIKNEPCIFYQEGICSIYDDRPLVCRSYPLMYNPEENRIEINGDCPQDNKFKILLNQGKLDEQMLAAKMMTDLNNRYMQIVHKYVLQGKIKIIQENKNWEPIGVHDFFNNLGENFHPFTFNQAIKLMNSDKKK